MMIYQTAKDRLIKENELPPIPNDWTVERFRYVFKESKERNGREPVGEMLSVSEYHGVVPKTYEHEEQKRTAEELETYRVVRPSQLAVNTMWLNHLGLGVSSHVGHVSPAYSVYCISQKILPDYAHHLLRSTYYLSIYNRYLYGIRPNSYQIKSDDWASIPIILPPLSTQHAIADFLDRETARIDQLIEKKQRLVELLEEKAQSFAERALESLDKNDCLTAKLAFFVTKVGSGKTPRGGAETYVDSGVAFLRSQNVHNDGLRLDQVAYIDHEVDAEMKNTRVLQGDVLLNITGGSLGRCSVATINDLPANVSQHVSIIRSSKRLIPEFLHLQLLSRKIQDVIRLESFSANREGLTADDIKNLVLMVPKSIDQQLNLVGVANAKRSSAIETIRKVLLSIDRLREFRSALITAAVTGQIDVDEWSRKRSTDAKLDAIAKEMESES